MTAAPILRSAHVHRPIDEAFALFTEQIGSWWPLPTHGLFGDRAGGVDFVGGKLVERSFDGHSTIWGEVLTWEPPSRLAITWHPGREASDASIVEVTFRADADGTRIEISHHGWEAFGEEAAARRRTYVGPNAWGYVLDFYCRRDEAREESIELAELRTAYNVFFQEAVRGGFGDPPAGEWSAAQVVAHIAVNDDAMSNICRSLIHGRDIVFDNTSANDSSVLDAVVAGTVDMEALVERGRHRSQVLLGLLATLDADQLDSAVRCHLIDHDAVVLDQPVPWGQMALRTQATFHLPLHARQLEELRPRD